MTKKGGVEKPKVRSKKTKPFVSRAPRRAAAAKPPARKITPNKKSWSAVIARGSAALVVIAAGYLIVTMTAALAAAGYFTSESLAFAASAAANQPAKIGLSAPSNTPVQNLPPVNQETASNSSQITFLVTPSTIAEGRIKIAPGAVRIVGSAPGASRVEVALTPTGIGVADLEQVIASGPAAEDGGFDIEASFPKGTLGHLRIKAYAKDDQAVLSELRSLAAE